jgi:predicted MPP superfamily phosphohydrolase
MNVFRAGHGLARPGPKIGGGAFTRRGRGSGRKNHDHPAAICGYGRGRPDRNRAFMTLQHPGTKTAEASASARAAWYRRRTSMEAGSEKHTPDGVKTRHWDLFKLLIGLFGVGLKVTGLYRRGLRNALDVRLRRLELAFPDLPAAFDGFKILQLSDLHVDFLPGTLDAALGLLPGLEADLCVLTGDFRKRVSGPYEQILPSVARLTGLVSARHGVFAVLGNHDCADMAAAFERLGITVLVNETRSIRQSDTAVHVTGTDDVHYYYTAAAKAALDDAPMGFKIALIHSAELADMAADAGFHLYLAGHSHAGQVCLPGGIPVITHMNRLRPYAAGLWRRAGMVGYSSSGLGVSGLPVRFNTRGEIVLITLRREAPGGADSRIGEKTL